MADGKFLIGKPAGGVTTVTMTDGAGNTNLVLPESGTVATQAYVDDLKIIATGTATFTATTNNINLTGIGVGVEIGDVIQISGAEDAKNNSEFTIEVITDANNIIVNQAHANKGTSKNVAARASDTEVTVKLLAKWYNAPIGLGQGLVSVTRSINTNYQNTTNRSIEAIVFTNTQSVVFTMDGSVIGTTSSTVGQISSFIIPANSIISRSAVYTTWYEIR